jgi:geranylgeranylglycerol-phosphate geranylgeranyltransferase
MRGPRFAGALTAHVQTWRPYTLWYAGLVGLSGAALAADRASWSQLGLAWLVPTLVWVAAHYLGDYLDRELDGISKPQRPIPSGRMRPATALLCGSLLAAASCVLALIVNWRTVVLLLIGIGGAVAYNGFFKARGLWGNLMRGALTGAALVFGSMVVLSQPSLRSLPFALAFVAHDASSNLVGTLRDVSGDRAGGYRTFAVRHGTRAAAWTASALYGLAIAAAAAGLLLPSAGAAHLFPLLPAIALGCRAFQLAVAADDALTPRRALRAHEVLTVERLLFAGALLAPGLGPLVALVILLPALAITLSMQRTMRVAHEFSPKHMVLDGTGRPKRLG